MILLLLVQFSANHLLLYVHHGTLPHYAPPRFCKDYNRVQESPFKFFIANCAAAAWLVAVLRPGMRRRLKTVLTSRGKAAIPALMSAGILSAGPTKCASHVSMAVWHNGVGRGRLQHDTTQSDLIWVSSSSDNGAIFPTQT